MALLPLIRKQRQIRNKKKEKMLFYFLKVSCNKYMMVKQSITKVKRSYSATISLRPLLIDSTDNLVEIIPKDI